MAPNNPRHLSAILAACQLIEAESTLPPLAALAGAAQLSPHHFHRQFKAVLGITPRAYADAIRALRLRAALPTSGSVTDALFEAGFSSSSGFYERVQSLLGMTPAAFRKGGEGERIRFGIGQCTLGAILVAATGKGLCSIALGDDPVALLEALQERFPHAELCGDEPDFEDWMACVIGFVDGRDANLALPLDVRGTAFQQRVWQALQSIPPGSTLSYTELAQKLGTPRAVRAVASACAANTLAIAIPCHRIVRSDGSLSGYRWGIDRKRMLIDREAKVAASASLAPA
ncbi:methylated-DNA--[protein]-cysteine S-methyltransferase [Viridibacterium curvum]|uniref:HTH araC/xylS-type domain-containing protein n=1 Tax=Viridibacterium curvum TaxID=1101404 RepID=A0ABP9Q9S8_9RHOO